MRIIGTRPRFLPDLARGSDRQTVNARFRAEAEHYKLLFQCTDCVYQRESDGRCTVGWPNDGLMADPVEIIGARGEPLVCKAFEPDGM